jgi:hypothetical protein
VKRCLALACALALFGLARGDGKAKPNSLTPKEVSEGWILLFDGESTFGWEIDGDAKVENGELVLGGTKATTARPTSKFGEFQFVIEHASGGPVKLGNATVAQNDSATNRISMTDSVNGDNDYFPVKVEAGKVARLSGIKIKPTKTRSLFNGKDLTGWKKFETLPARAKSQFTVTDDGEIHLKDGPGDLQTEAQFKDFVLQIECRTNGSHLNSGVFFRCIPGLYQQGYESQIHNHFTAEPMRPYTIQDYDPKTHELKKSTKVKATAVDFGTGAIYRQVPARKSVAKDGEWFTMTIVANGRHLATWVNGIQVTDFTDNRPEKENARNGCKLEKGAISLQGHDKTTDLSFRNIRIEELADRHE